MKLPTFKTVRENRELRERVAELKARRDAERARNKERIKDLKGEISDLRNQRDALRQVAAAQPPTGDWRTILCRYISGTGLEIGALHRPLPVPESATVRYVDYRTREENIENCPEINADDIVETHFVCNGEKLEIIEPASQDFIIANHMIEHCINPIGTISRFVEVLRDEGVLFITLPDKRYTFDFRRDVTPFAAVADDFRNQLEREPLGTYVDWVKHCDISKGQNPEHLHHWQSNIHFHVWTQAEMVELFARMKRDLGIPIEIEAVGRNGHEVVLILRKTIPEEWDRASPSTKAEWEAIAVGS